MGRIWYPKGAEEMNITREQYFSTIWFIRDLPNMKREAVINTVRRMEAADVVAVVRCKHCKWWDEWCDELDENGYCHHGERKDDEID